MPLFDLSHVTASLTRALKFNIQRLEPALPVVVTTQPPERVSGATNTVNLYLYHVTEDPHYRNLAGNLSDARPAQTKPMSLILYYILTTHHEGESGFETEIEQRLMGHALKTLHDFAVIDDETRIPGNGTEILHPDLRGRDNRLEVTLRPVGPEDALAFWSAEERQTARLSAYYEVRYALLEPEPPRRLPGVVLSLGTFLVNVASPQLAGSQSAFTFTLPASAGGGAQTITASPARVGPTPAANRLTLLGTNLAIGQARRLYLRNARWRQRVSELDRVLVDFDLPQNAAAGWSITTASDWIEVTVGTELTVAVPVGPPIVLPLEPGIYHARLEVVKELRVIQGQLKEITDTSNETAFAVAPLITGFSVLDAAERRIGIDLHPSIDLTPAGPPGLPEIMVVVDGENYARHDPAEPGAIFEAGEFLPTGASVEFVARFDPSVAGTHPFRLIVEGAESQPFWIELP